MPRLLGMSESVKGQVFNIEAEQIQMGRQMSNDVRVDDSTVSHKHCLLFREGGKYWLRDLGSTNGTRVNNHPIKESELHNRDIITLGQVLMMFDMAEEAEEEPVASVAVSQDIRVAVGDGRAPEDFASLSPFGTHVQQSDRKFWMAAAVFLVAGIGSMGMALVSILTTRPAP